MASGRRVRRPSPWEWSPASSWWGWVLAVQWSEHLLVSLGGRWGWGWGRVVQAGELRRAGRGPGIGLHGCQGERSAPEPFLLHGCAIPIRVCSICSWRKVRRIIPTGARWAWRKVGGANLSRGRNLLALFGKPLFLKVFLGREALGLVVIWESLVFASAARPGRRRRAAWRWDILRSLCGREQAVM